MTRIILLTGTIAALTAFPAWFALAADPTLKGDVTVSYSEDQREKLANTEVEKATEEEQSTRMNKKEMAEKLAKKADSAQQESPKTPSDVETAEEEKEAGLLLPAVQKVRSSAAKTESDDQDTAAPPRQTKGIAIPPTDPQDPAEPEEPEEPSGEGVTPEEPKKEEALHHLRKAYD